MLIVFVIIIWAIVFGLRYNNRNDINQNIDTSQLVSKYIRENISQLSPQKEVLGGKFYVTSLDLIDDKTGKVEYEDGHIALKATFNFQIKNNQVIIDKFAITNNN